MFGAPERRALRAAIAATVAFYLGWIVIDDAVLAVFATLGVIGLLVLADFGGDLARQARAYVLATVVAGALVALGTVVSEHTCAAAGLLFVVALCVSLSTAVGRNVATARMASCCSSWSPAPFRRRSTPWTPEWPACSSAAASRWWQPDDLACPGRAEGAAGAQPRLTPLAAR